MLTPFWKKKNHNLRSNISSLTFDLQLENPTKNMAMSGHNTVLLPNGYLAIYGGYNNNKCKSDFYIMDLEELPDLNHKNIVSNKLYTSRIHADILPQLASSAMCSHPYKNIVYIFGGSGENWGRSNTDVFITINLDDNTQKISHTTENSGPPASYGATINFYKDKLYVFGGTNGNVFYNHIYEYDLKTEKWSQKHTIGKIPTARYRHNSFIVNDDLHIMNGGQYESFSDEMHVYKLNLKTFYWEQCKVLGDTPCNYIASGSSFDPEQNCVWIFGGRYGKNCRTNKIYRYSLETQHCKEFIFENNFKLVNSNLKKLHSPIEGREFHTVCIYKNKLISIAGSTGVERLGTLTIFYLPLMAPDAASI
jgi:hypothetical protein